MVDHIANLAGRDVELCGKLFYQRRWRSTFPSEASAYLSNIIFGQQRVTVVVTEHIPG
jgi:hypothetical protein